MRYPSYKQISCGCCTGDGTGVHSGNDRCTCHMHQDVPRGLPPHVCAHHAEHSSPWTGAPNRIDGDQAILAQRRAKALG